MTFSSEIYRRLDFGISILDESDERISFQETEVSVPSRQRRISDDLLRLNKGFRLFNFLQSASWI